MNMGCMCSDAANQIAMQFQSHSGTGLSAVPRLVIWKRNTKKSEENEKCLAINKCVCGCGEGVEG